MGLDSWLDKSGLLTVNICANPCNEKEEAIVGLDFKRRLIFHCVNTLRSNHPKLVFGHLHIHIIENIEYLQLHLG